MAHWTAKDIPDLSGKRAIVTGANSGLGFQTALELARHQCQVVLACRNAERGKHALAALLEQVPNARATVELLDLADLSSIADFANRQLQQSGEKKSLDLLINNAGVMHLPERKTKDGFEMQFGTNHFGHFALTAKLMPLLAATPLARIVTVSSMLHRRGKLNFDNLNAEQGYSRFKVYSNSKLANLIFAVELDRKLKALGLPVLSVAAHPGYSDTPLGLAGPEMEGSALKKKIIAFANSLFAQSDAQGSLPILYAATMPSVKGGEFYGPDGFKEAKGFPKLTRGIHEAYDESLAQKLWQVSEKLTGAVASFS